MQGNIVRGKRLLQGLRPHVDGHRVVELEPSELERFHALGAMVHEPCVSERRRGRGNEPCSLWQHHSMQDPPLLLRQGKPDDALIIGVLGTQVSLDTYATNGIRPLLAREVRAHFSTEAIAALLASPCKRFVLAEREGHLVGFVQLGLGQRHALVEADSAVEVERLFVQARFKNQGVGKALVAAAAAQARDSGARSLWLTAWVGNTDALIWYRRQGWLERGETDYVFEDEHFENRLFELPLGVVALTQSADARMSLVQGDDAGGLGHAAGG